jgi:hypothetical protein
MNWLRWWAPYFSSRWVVVTLAVGAGLLVLIGVVRAVGTIREFGWRSYLKSTFSVDNETWRLVGILLLMVIVVVMVFSNLA